ncbi:pirin family protein [Paracoccus sp. (in: a-proteobacteria)]|uniref:pirin family protein n=1 Tax=Paracoccus sp. TaxID=267 RepID=UPI00321FDB27
MRQILGIHSAPPGHWVGDGFPVRSLFSHASHGEQLSPFLLLDHAGPAHFDPAGQPRGVGTHPHRGFETVTIVYAGEVEHRDSTGAGGVIGPGDVQWMTAASGILHNEFHSQAFTRSGGTLEMVQLWVNLPAKDKNARPGYQNLTAERIPALDIAGGSGRLRVIAGEYGGHRGPARTFTPIEVWDLRLDAGAETSLTLPEGHTVAVVALQGRLRLNGTAGVGQAEFALLAREGGAFTLAAEAESRVLVLAGAPILEPVVMQGPFAMNSMAEIRDALRDFHSGRFGKIPG